MAENYRRVCGCLMACVGFSTCGCFFASYPDVYDASDFEEFEFRIETDPPCLEGTPRSGYSPLCEATIKRDASGGYVVVLGVQTEEQSDSSYLPERALTEQEAEYMLALFDELHINLHPQPFCTIPRLGSMSGETVFRWDDFELVEEDCDRARLDWGDARDIHYFLSSLQPDWGCG